MLKIKILPNNNFRISGDIISDSIKREKVKFDFTEEWEGFIKTAVFSYGDDTVINIILNGENELCTAEDECYIPFEVLKSPCFSISVFGLKGDIRLTTPKREVKVTKSGYELGDSPEMPTPDEYAQLTQMFNEIKEIAVSVRTDADNGLFKGEKGDDATVTVDQTYTSTSENAQSGKAVAEALEEKIDEEDANNLFANALKGNVSGENFEITDISPIRHIMSVKVRNKNLFDFYNADKVNGAASFEKQYNKIIVSQSDTNSYVSANLQLPDELIGKTVTISAKAHTSGANIAQIRIQWTKPLTGNAAGNMILSNATTGAEDTLLTASGIVPEQPDEEHNILSLLFYSTAGNGNLVSGETYTSTYSDIQIELGTQATEYTPHINDLSRLTVWSGYSEPGYNFIKMNEVNKDGIVSDPFKKVIGVISTYPYIKLWTETKGIIIDCEYNKDLNKGITVEKAERDYADTLLRQDISEKLPKNPTDWEEWTAEEQAAARERMGIPGDYELIEEITLEEDVNFISRSNEPDGTPYRFSAFYIIADIIVSDSDTASYMCIDASSDTNRDLFLEYFPRSGLTDKRINLHYEAISPNLFKLTSELYNKPHDPFSDGKVGIRNYNYDNIPILSTIVNNISFRNIIFLAGTKIKIYGVRA